MITETSELRQFYSDRRSWQGIPAIEKTPGGRLLAAFYSGGVTEQLGNYVVLVKSDDDGRIWSEPVAAVYYGEKTRCFDECLWMDPLGRLWLFWACQPDFVTKAAICENPDEDELIWGGEFTVGEGVMLNKPIVARDGRWLFPLSVWRRGVRIGNIPESEAEDRRAFVYETRDMGRHFRKTGGAECDNRLFDEHMLVEKADGTLDMYFRTKGNLEVSHSSDGGVTWSYGKDSGIRSPGSRFFIGRLSSGRLLLVNHHDFCGRNHLKAMLSEDEGRSFRGFLMIDERQDVSYPDAVEDSDGHIYIIYDRERGSFGDPKVQAKEILLAKITENDILNGKVASNGCYLKRIVSKLVN